MAEAAGRHRGVRIVRPIVYGNTAQYFGKKRDEDGHTHQWRVFLRPYYAEDCSKWIRKVSFKLHESYPNSTRVLESPPFEVSETGWGEFEVTIRIYFTDPSEKAVTAYHMLKLFQADPAVIAGKKAVVSEVYDEVVFQDPTNLMFNSLQPPVGKGTAKSRINGFDTDFENKKERHLKHLRDARAQVRSEIDDLRESLKEAQSTIQKYRGELAALGPDDSSILFE